MEHKCRNSSHALDDKSDSDGRSDMNMRRRVCDVSCREVVFKDVDADFDWIENIKGLMEICQML